MTTYSIHSKSIFLTLLALTALAGAPPTGRAQTILGSAQDFSLLAKTSITNNGPTTLINGNVGLSPGTSITGFQAVDGGTAVVVNGSVIIGGTATPAVADFQTVFTALANMPFDTDLSSQDLGGMILFPGVYRFNVAATQALSTTLTLDAQGKTNVFWVFQMAETLITGANTNILLINSPDNGKSDGLFWDVHTAITFGASSAEMGNYLAGTSITYGGTTTGSGARAFAQAAITLDSNSVNTQTPAGGDFTGALMYNSSGAVVPLVIPEPAAFLWLAPLGAMGVAVWRRKRAGVKINQK